VRHFICTGKRCSAQTSGEHFPVRGGFPATTILVLGRVFLKETNFSKRRIQFKRRNRSREGSKERGESFNGRVSQQQENLRLIDSWRPRMLRASLLGLRGQQGSRFVGKNLASSYDFSLPFLLTSFLGTGVYSTPARGTTGV
jgi:hypothetical protein